ncbi:MAG: hypothetical protein K6E90_10510 [Lachnospiraceae bacterium]|nr:hypothetical protein [Lachnospiraceae bacterium]
MRDMVFKMEIEYPQIKEGAEVSVEEGYLQDGLVVYYTIVPAVAMSGNFKRQEALRSDKGIVKALRRDEESGAFYVTVSFDE